MFKDRELDESTVGEYFNTLKSTTKSMSDSDLKKFYENCFAMKDKFLRTGQIDAIKKLIFLIEVVSKEEKCLSLGISKYIYRGNIHKYLKEVRSEAVAFVELCKYERVIPDDIIEKIDKCKDVFDNMYVLFTDYSNYHKEKFKKETDPILFGVFENSDFVHDRFYVIGDWVDEFCDLTLERFIEDFSKIQEEPVVNTIQTDVSIAEMVTLKNLVNSLEFNRDTGKYEQKQPPASLWERFKEKVKSVL